VYKRAIIKAIEELSDYDLRSNISAIRNKVQDIIQDETSSSSKSEQHHQHFWNETIFLKTLKSLSALGDIQQTSAINVELSSEFKKKRTTKLAEILEKKILMTVHPRISPHGDEVKTAPKRKPEHAKLKIIPRREYDKL
jgi:hypothetical protein